MPTIAWLGGVAFAVALGGLTYLFTVTLSRPGTSTGGWWSAALVDVALFSLFAAHHSVFARPRVKRWLARVIPASAERSLYVWVASVLCLAMCAWWQPLPGMLYQAHGVPRIACWVLQAAGLALIVRAAAAIDPLELAGIRQVSGRRAPAPLTMSGPFHLVRHPIYLGFILVVAATPTMTASRALFAAVATAYLLLAIPFEERSLTATHGAEYEAYRRRVPWRIVPGLW